MKRERKRIVEGLRELAAAVDSLGLVETDHRARLLRIIAGSIRWDMRNAKDCRDESLAMAMERFRRAFGEPGDWGNQTPIGQALCKVYGHSGRIPRTNK
jgi:hypothetical protein